MISSISAGILAFLLTLIGIPAFIRFYRKAQITGQQMHEDVKQHQAKAGTPTMGGLVFLIVAVVVSFLVALFTQQLTNNVGMILFILVLYGLVGFLDDFLKVFRKINDSVENQDKENHNQAIGQLLGKQSCHKTSQNRGNQKDGSPHRRRSSLSLMLLDIFVHLLA